MTCWFIQVISSELSNPFCRGNVLTFYSLILYDPPHDKIGFGAYENSKDCSQSVKLHNLKWPSNILMYIIVSLML